MAQAVFVAHGRTRGAFGLLFIRLSRGEGLFSAGARVSGEKLSPKWKIDPRGFPHQNMAKAANVEKYFFPPAVECFKTQTYVSACISAGLLFNVAAKEKYDDEGGGSRRLVRDLISLGLTASPASPKGKPLAKKASFTKLIKAFHKVKLSQENVGVGGYAKAFPFGAMLLS